MMHTEVCKEELAQAIDRQLRVIINILLFKKCTIKALKNKAVPNLKQYCMHCYVALGNVF